MASLGVVCPISTDAGHCLIRRYLRQQLGQHGRVAHAGGEQGCDPRFIVTNLPGRAQALYDEVYCQRGEAENRIKEAQVGLFATRTNCHVLRSNQLRTLLAALGCVLIERLRALALQGTALAAAQVETLRIKLLKVDAVVTRNTRRIRLYLAGAMTQKRPVTQAGVGVGAGVWLMRAISDFAAVSIEASFVHISAAKPHCAGRWLLA